MTLSAWTFLLKYLVIPQRLRYVKHLQILYKNKIYENVAVNLYKIIYEISEFCCG